MNGMRGVFSIASRGALAAAIALIAANTAQATPMLTAAGISDGFSLSTFATVAPGNTGCCGGPFGVAVTGNGNVLVNVGGTGTRYAFQDADGQTTASALHAVPSDSFVTAYASAGGQAYGSEGGRFVQFNNDGTVNHVLTGVNARPNLGMWGNPVDGHIIATSSAGLIDINPLANGGLGSFRTINSGGGDGVSVSPDGKIAYVEQGSINGYDIATGNLVFASGSIFPSPDGTGVISSSNALNGKIVVNNNNGEVDLLDPLTKTFTAIITGGTRGDYTSPDPTNGSLFLDFADIVARLSCGAGCAIGAPPPPPSTVPEPPTVALLGLGLFVLAWRTRRGPNNAGCHA